MVLSRRSLLASSAALALAPRRGFAQAPRRGGVLRVAADSEYRNWNPAIAANNGVFLVACKVIEPLFDARRRRQEPGAGAGDRVDAERRREDPQLRAARRREVA